MEDINKALNLLDLEKKNNYENNFTKNLFNYFILNTEISDKLNENSKKFILDNYLKARGNSKKKLNIFDIYVECLNQMKNNVEIFSEKNLFDIYLPQEYIIFYYIFFIFF